MNKTLATTILLILLSLAGCASEKTIKIGYIGPLSGPSAVLGIDTIQAIEMAAQEINSKGGIDGAKIQIIAEDDQYTPEKTVTAYNKLVQVDDVKYILMSTYGGVFAIKDQAVKDDVLIIDTLDCNNELAALDNHILCLATETESIGQSLADYAIKHNMTKIGILYGTKDNFMSLVTEAFKARFSGRGTVIEERYSPDTSDFKTHLMKLDTKKPDALFLLGYDELGIAMKQARDLGIDATFMGAGTFTSPGLQQSSQGTSEGALLSYWEPDSENQKSSDFEKAFIARVGRPPILPLTTHPAYDTMQILLTKVIPGVEKIRDPAKNSATAIDLFISTKGFQGVTGTVKMESDGAARIRESVFRLEGGNPVKP